MSKPILIRNCRMKTRCDRKWEELSESSPEGLLKDLQMDGVRYCDRCKDFVWKCENKQELVDAITLNQCVAFIDWDGTISGHKNKPLLGSVKMYE